MVLDRQDPPLEKKPIVDGLAPRYRSKIYYAKRLGKTKSGFYSIPLWRTIVMQDTNCTSKIRRVLRPSYHDIIATPVRWKNAMERDFMKTLDIYGVVKFIYQHFLHYAFEDMLNNRNRLKLGIAEIGVYKCSRLHNYTLMGMRIRHRLVCAINPSFSYRLQIIEKIKRGYEYEYL